MSNRLEAGQLSAHARDGRAVQGRARHARRYTTRRGGDDERRRMSARSALSFWCPMIEIAGLPVPRTHLIKMPKKAIADVWQALDGKDGDGSLGRFCDQKLAPAARDVGFPCFLRTEHTSAKHDWDRTCHVPSADVLCQHVVAIAEFSECVSMTGELPWDSWAVRELLPTIPMGRCPGFGNMPICREFRFFVDGGEVRCWHPYWPQAALEQGGANKRLDYAALCRMDNEDELRTLAAAVGRAVGGAWSVDLLETERGWYVTDMAEASRSFHWEGCKNAHDTQE